MLVTVVQVHSTRFSEGEGWVPSWADMVDEAERRRHKQRPRITLDALRAELATVAAARPDARRAMEILTGRRTVPLQRGDLVPPRSPYACVYVTGADKHNKVTVAVRGGIRGVPAFPAP